MGDVFPRFSARRSDVGQQKSLTVYAGQARCFGRGGRIRTDDLRVMSTRFQYRDVSFLPSVKPLSQINRDFAIASYRHVQACIL